MNAGSLSVNNKIAGETKQGKITAILNMLAPSFDPVKVFAWSAVAFLLIVPYLVIFYPGLVEIDTVFQLAEHLGYGDGFNGDGSWTSLFPVFCAQFYGMLYDMGCSIGGDQTGGILAISLFQSLGISLAGATLICYLSKWNVPAWARILVLFATFAIPVLPHQAVNIGKDTLFTIFFLAYFTCFLETVRTKGECLRHKPLWLIFTILTAVGLSLARSTGLYLVAISAFMAPIFFCRNAVTMAFQMIPLALAAIAVTILGSYSTNVLGTTDVGMREIMGTPIQQTAYYVKHGGEISDEEWNALNSFYNVDKATEKLEPQMTDNAKIHYRIDGGSKNLPAFLSTYFTLGMRNPGLYWEAWYALYSGYIEVGTFDSLATVRFMPCVPIEELDIKYVDGMDFPDDFDKMWSFIDNDQVIYTQRKLPEYKETHPEFGEWEPDETMEQTSKDVFGMLFGWAQLPVLGIFVSKSLYVLYLPVILLLMSVIAPNRKTLFPMMVPLFCITLFAFVSPVDFTRYILPEVAADFAVLALFLSNLKREIPLENKVRERAKMRSKTKQPTSSIPRQQQLDSDTQHSNGTSNVPTVRRFDAARAGNVI